MKLLASLLMFLSLAATGVSQAGTDRDRDGLKGRVQKVRTLKATTINEGGVSTETPLLTTHAVTYDEAGRRTELALYDSNGLIARRTVYEYERHSGRRSGLIIFDANNVMTRRVSDTYGSSGFQKQRVVEDFNEDGSLFRKQVVTLDAVGDITEVVTHAADGTVVKETPPFKDPARATLVISGSHPHANGELRVLNVRRSGSEYLDTDEHGNWTRSVTALQSAKKKARATEVVYRVFTYY